MFKTLIIVYFEVITEQTETRNNFLLENVSSHLKIKYLTCVGSRYLPITYL